MREFDRAASLLETDGPPFSASMRKIAPTTKGADNLCLLQLLADEAARIPLQVQLVSEKKMRSTIHPTVANTFPLQDEHSVLYLHKVLQKVI